VNKEQFLRTYHFEPDLKAPLVVAVSRLRQQKGIDWVVARPEALARPDALLRKKPGRLGALLAVVGEGDRIWKRPLLDWKKNFQEDSRS